LWSIAAKILHFPSFPPKAGAKVISIEAHNQALFKINFWQVPQFTALVCPLTWRHPAIMKFYMRHATSEGFLKVLMPVNQTKK